MTTLQLKNIVKRYKSQAVLDGLSLDVADGERLVLFGPSGAGKTVLLRLIAGVIEPEEGRVLIGGEDMTDVDAEHRGVGMAFQNFALFPHMSAFDNIASALTSRKSSKEMIAAGVQKVAKLLKIDHVLSHHPKALSNGQKQRTALAARWSARLPCCFSTIRSGMSTPSCASRCGWNCRGFLPPRARR
jgi:multiple sugar transport system ATP-binding protein